MGSLLLLQLLDALQLVLSGLQVGGGGLEGDLGRCDSCGGSGLGCVGRHGRRLRGRAGCVEHGALPLVDAEVLRKGGGGRHHSRGGRGGGGGAALKLNARLRVHALQVRNLEQQALDLLLLERNLVLRHALHLVDDAALARALH